jgi:hypothetical protein
MNDEQPTDNLRDIPRPTETLDHRVSNVEKHNQIRRIASTDGLTYFDTEEGRIVINDGTNDRVIIGKLD